MVAKTLAISCHESQDSAKDYNRFRFTWMEYPRAPQATHVAKVLHLECMYPTPSKSCMKMCPQKSAVTTTIDIKY